MDIEELLVLLKERPISDLHLSEGLAPYYRQGNQLAILPFPCLTKEMILSFAFNHLDELQKSLFHREGYIDFALSWQDLRLRLNLFKQQRGLFLAIRLLPETIPSLDALYLPAILKEIALYNEGLVLIAGPTGSGKSTTLAALINHMNQQHKKHIISIEDPIEFIHQSKSCLIQQKEIGRDSPNFGNALKGILREDPDVIVISELRSLETIRMALTAAETGHLVLASIHSPSAIKTINRLIDVFGQEEKALIRTLLADSLRAIIAQKLYPIKGEGRILATEVLVNNPAIRNLICENKLAQIYSLMQTGKNQQMHTLDQALEALSIQGLI